MNENLKSEDGVETRGDAQKPAMDGWSRERPNTDGRWLWREGDDREEVELVLSALGTEVGAADEDEPDGAPQSYWERTETTQETMPGLWKRITPATDSDESARIQGK